MKPIIIVAVLAALGILIQCVILVKNLRLNRKNLANLKTIEAFKNTLSKPTDLSVDGKNYKVELIEFNRSYADNDAFIELLFDEEDPEGTKKFRDNFAEDILFEMVDQIVKDNSLYNVEYIGGPGTEQPLSVNAQLYIVRKWES